MSSKKRSDNLRRISQETLDKFKRLVRIDINDEITPRIFKGWQNFIDEEIEKLSTIKNIESILGFGRKLSKQLTHDQLISKIGECFAEINLAVHILREYRANEEERRLEKLMEEPVSGKMCDFRLVADRLYFESKYTSNLGNVLKISQNALAQIANTDRKIHPDKKGIIWIFSYSKPDNGSQLRKHIEDIHAGLRNNVDFPFSIRLQIYSSEGYGGIYGSGSLWPT